MKQQNDRGFMPAAPLEKKNEMIIRDKSHPRSVINLVPEAVSNAIERLPTTYVDIGECELRKILDEEGYVLSPLDYRIRHMFWREYDTAQTNVRDMVMTNVYYGLCSREQFYLLLQNKERTAWMLCPPVDYVIATEEALIFGIEELRRILAMDHIGILGKIDPKLAGVKLEIVKMLDIRVKGAVIQTTKNLNVNVEAPSMAKEPPKMEEVDRKIRELEEQLKSLNEGKKSPKDIEVEVTGVREE